MPELSLSLSCSLSPIASLRSLSVCVAPNRNIDPEKICPALPVGSWSAVTIGGNRSRRPHIREKRTITHLKLKARSRTAAFHEPPPQTNRRCSCDETWAGMPASYERVRVKSTGNFIISAPWFASLAMEQLQIGSRYTFVEVFTGPHSLSIRQGHASTYAPARPIHHAHHDHPAHPSFPAYPSS